MRKPGIFIGMIVLLIIIGILLAVKVTRDFRVKPTSSKKVENKVESKNINKTEEQNLIENPEENIENNEEEEEQKPKTDLEKAIDIVKEDWGAEDSSVYYAEDRKNFTRRFYNLCKR